MPRTKKEPKIPVAFRIRGDLRKLIAKLAARENISQTRMLEICIERQAKGVGRNPFREPAA